MQQYPIVRLWKLSHSLGYLIRLCVLLTILGVNPSWAQPPPVPASGAYIGAVLEQSQIQMYEFNRRTQVRHAIFMAYIEFPKVLDTSGADYQKLSAFISNCKAAGAMSALTIETVDGLDSYSTAQVQQFADMLASFDQAIFLRWNHEMNGTWYPWGQHPSAYVAKFREFADIIHASAKNTAMVWSPNVAMGYPWGGSGNPQDMPLLDTSGDGLFGSEDDPFSPYYPGDAYVDWVALSFFHWGNELSTGFNQIPYAGKWGEYLGANNPLWNLHDRFAVSHQKPMLIAETSAFFDPLNLKGGGALEADIKRSWISQVYNLKDGTNPSLSTRFPMIKAIIWFNELKKENELNGGQSNWRIDTNPEVLSYYTQTVSDLYFRQAPFLYDSVAIASAPPEIRPASNFKVTLQYSASEDRDVVLNLLDGINFEWFGGVRTRVSRGAGTLELEIKTPSSYPLDRRYLWDGFIAPLNADWNLAYDREQLSVTALEAVPEVSLVVSKITISRKKKEKSLIRIQRQGDISRAVQVKLTLKGSAVNGVDYRKIPTTMTIRAGSSSAVRYLTPIIKKRATTTKRAIVEIVSSKSYYKSATSRSVITIKR